MTTAKELETALFNKYLRDQTGYCALREVSIDDLAAMGGKALTRRGRRRVSGPTTRRLDMLLIKTAVKGVRIPYERHGMELKVSRADFFREVKDPGKRQAWHKMCHRFTYVVPRGMIGRHEVPEGCGLLEYDPDTVFGSQRLKWAVFAPYRDSLPDSFDDRFVVYLAGRASRAEAELRATTKKKLTFK
jgi:hypothetical protein